MNYTYYFPEGHLLHTVENMSCISSISGIERAMREGKILEANVIMCDEEMNLHIDLCGIRGIIPRNECLLTNSDEEIKDIAIITRVGKSVCFKVTSIESLGDTYKVILSRKQAQAECRNLFLSSLIPGDIIKATVTHLDTFGAFVDIGCGIISLLSIDCISVSRINHPSDRLSGGQRLNVIVKSNDIKSGRIYVTLKELLGTWEENASLFSVGQTVSGRISSIEPYGAFVELAPNLAGLAEIREDNPSYQALSPGDNVSVYIKSILPDKMKIKLVLIDVNTAPAPIQSLKYFIDTKNVSHVSAWKYSPDSCKKNIESVFD